MNNEYLKGVTHTQLYWCSRRNIFGKRIVIMMGTIYKWDSDGIVRENGGLLVGEWGIIVAGSIGLDIMVIIDYHGIWVNTNNSLT